MGHHNSSGAMYNTKIMVPREKEGYMKAEVICFKLPTIYTHNLLSKCLKSIAIYQDVKTHHWTYS